MSEWTSYALSDLLMFAPATYDRLVARANALWPAAAMLGLLLLALRHRVRLAFAIVLAASLLVAYWFHLRHYAEINLAAGAFAWLFVIQSLLLLSLLLWAPEPTGRGAGARPGTVLLVTSLLILPLVDWLAGRPAAAIGLFAIAPDPTALATIGLALAAGGPWAWVALPLPVLWLLLSALTQIALARPEGLLAPLLAVAAIAATVWLRRRAAGP